MGMWAYGPRDNDTAADWLSGLFTTELRDFWLVGIESEELETKYAALWIFVQLGYNFCWDYENLESDKKLAIKVAKTISLDTTYADEIRLTATNYYLQLLDR